MPESGSKTGIRSCHAPCRGIHDAEPPRGELIVDAMIQHDDAVGDVFLDTPARELPFAALGGDDGGQAAIFQPLEEAHQFGAKDRLVGYRGKERFDGIQHNAFCLDRINGESDTNKQSLKIEVARFRNLIGALMWTWSMPSFLFDELVDVESQGADILGEFIGSFFEGNENAGFVEFADSPDEKFHGKKRFAAAGPAAYQRGSAFREAAAGDLVKPVYPRTAFGQFGKRWRGRWFSFRLKMGTGILGSRRFLGSFARGGIVVLTAPLRAIETHALQAKITLATQNEIILQHLACPSDFEQAGSQGRMRESKPVPRTLQGEVT